METVGSRNVAGSISGSMAEAIPSSSKEKDLQKLLLDERSRSRQRQENCEQLKNEQIKLRADYLNLQSDIKSILEETKVLKKQKEDELDIARNQIKEQEQLIEKLRKDLNQRDQQLEKEKDKLIRENEILKEKLTFYKQKVEDVQKTMEDSIERSKAEVNRLRDKMLEYSKTPEGQQIKNLSDEVTTLTSRLKNKEKALEDATRQYVTIREVVENLTLDQQKSSIEHERQIDLLRGQLNATREDALKLDDIVKLIRREKDRLKSEIVRLEREADTHEKTIVNMEKTFEQEKERLRRLFVKEKTDLEIERNSLIDQIKRLKVDLELKSEQINCLEKTIETKEKEFQLQTEFIKQQAAIDKSALDRERLTFENRIAEVNEEKNRLKNELDDCKRLLESNHEIRLKLQSEVMKSQLKVESFQCYHEEIERLRKSQKNSLEELDKVRSELTTISAIKKDLSVQLVRSEEEYNRVKAILEEERKETVRIKMENDEMISRLRNNLDEERNELKIKIENLNCEIRKKHKEREEIKSKCKQYQTLVEKLQLKVKSLEENLTTIRQSIDEMVPIKAYKELKKQYKDLKHKINDLPTSNLVNHHQQPALSSQHCIKVNKLTREKQTTTTS